MASGLTAQLRVSTEEELQSKLAEAKAELFNLRFQGATGQLESHGRLRAVRKITGRSPQEEQYERPSSTHSPCFNLASASGCGGLQPVARHPHDITTKRR